MSKKGTKNFINQVAKEKIKERKQDIKKLENFKRQQYINDKYKEADISTEKIEIYINKLNNILNNDVKKIPIEEFIKKDLNNLEIAEELLVPNIEPSRPIIRKPNFMEMFFETYKENYKLYIKNINEKYEKEYALYKQKENNRKREIISLINIHKLKTNEFINTKLNLYKNKDTTIMSNYEKEILNQIKYPFEFKKCINVVYCKDSNKLVIDYLLPSIDIVPKEKEYKYIKTKDEIKITNRNEKDRNIIYNNVIFSIALNTIKIVFDEDIDNNINSVVFNGYIKTIDLSKGQDIAPYIISFNIDKNLYKNIDMNRIDKLKCIKQTLNGRVKINSNLEFKEITPLAKCDYSNKIICNSESMNLLKIDPFSFEDLVIELFKNMGYEVVGTKKSNDGGIDFELYNNDPIIGGKVIGQVKRYKNNIDIPKLREFESVLRNSDAMKGIYISTSNFSPQCERFASENNITLINGTILVNYLNEYGLNSYISD